MYHLYKLLFIAFIWLLLSTLLGYPEFSYFNSFLQSCFMLFWSYAGHVLAHKVSDFYPINILNTHISFHHDSDLKSKFSRWVDLSLEALNNFMGFFIIYIFQKLFGLHIFSLNIILYVAFLYICLHIFYYSLTGNKYHAQHHITPDYNYSPEIFDIIFNTRKESIDDISLAGEIFPAFVAVGLVLILNSLSITSVASASARFKLQNYGISD